MQYWPSQAVMVLLSGTVSARTCADVRAQMRPHGHAGVAAGDGPLVGAEVRRDDQRVVAHLVGRARSAITAPGLEAVDAVADRHHERHVVLDHEHRGVELLADAQQQRAERLGLALGDAGGRLVEAEHPGVGGEQAGELDDAPHAGRQLADEPLAVGPETEEVEDLVGVRPLGPLDPPGPGQPQGDGDEARRGRGSRPRPAPSRAR